jgi:subtilisin family serine protease
MFRSPLSRCFVALAAILVLTGLAADASAQDKLDRALREGKRSGKTQRVILKSKPGYEAWARKLLDQKNKVIDAEMPSVGGFAVELTASELDAFCAASVADGCSEDTIVRPSGSAKARKSTPARGKRNHNKGRFNGSRHSSNGPGAVYHDDAVDTLLGSLGLAPSYNGGAGVTVALIDSGIHPSQAFDNRIKAFYDFTKGKVRARTPFDDYGHGTHVAGLIGGRQYLRDHDFQEGHRPHQRRHSRH